MYLCMCMCVCMSVYECMCVCVYECVYVCVYECVSHSPPRWFMNPAVDTPSLKVPVPGSWVTSGKLPILLKSQFLVLQVGDPS